MTVLTTASLPQPPCTHRRTSPQHKQTGIPRKDGYHGQLLYSLADYGELEYQSWTLCFQRTARGALHTGIHNGGMEMCHTFSGEQMRVPEEA